MIKSLPMALRDRRKMIKVMESALCSRYYVVTVIMVYSLLSPFLSFAATLTGKVEVTGPYGIKPRKVMEEQIKAERSLVVSKDGGIKDAVVSIKGIKGKYPLQPSKEATIDQKNKKFIPHTLAIPVGSTVRFKSSDPFVHRIISDSEAKRLRLEFAYEGATVDVTFDKPGIIEIRCDDHKRMQGWILVMETPFFAVTDEKGRFIIPDIPAGRYAVEVWHEVLGKQAQEIEVKEDENVRVDFRLPGKEF